MGCVRGTACKSSALGPQLDGCLLSTRFLRLGVFFTSLPTGNIQESLSGVPSAFPDPPNAAGVETCIRNAISQTSNTPGRCFCHLLPKPGTTSTAYQGQSTSSFTLRETAPTKRLQRPSSTSSALRIAVNSSVRYKISHWFGFSSCCVLFTSQPSLLPAASSLSPRTALMGRCSGLRAREVGMLRAAGPATPGLPTPEKLCLFSLSIDED